MSPRAVACVLALACWAAPAGAAAQCFPVAGGTESCPVDAPDWVGHFAGVSANVLLGGLSAGVSNHVRGGSFAQGFTRGMLGGGVVAAGKWAAAQRFSAAGLAGRQLAAVGISMSRNAGAGEPLLRELVLPVGPVRLHVRATGGPRVSARVDAFATGWLIYGIAERELHFDWKGSLSAGTPVFRTDGTILRLRGDSAHAAGLTNAGVVFLADVPAYGSRFTRRALAHERVHVLQQDQLFALVTDPAEKWLLRRLPGGARAAAHVDLDASTELLRFLGRFFREHGDRPWELEAMFLAR